MKIQRATIQITEQISLQGWEVDGQYRLSAVDIAKAIEKGESGVRGWWESKYSESLRAEGLTIATVPNPEGGHPLNLFPTKVANRYWQHWLKLGHTPAIALICVLAEHAYNEILRTTRDHTIWTHPGFVLANKLNKFPGAQVHDLITVLCGGKTAKLARLDPQPLEGDMHTGLNHYQDAKLLETIARAKLKFTSMKYGSWQNRVTRSCIAALAEMGIQPSVKA